MSKEKPKSRELMIKLLYLICRNYHEYENSGIIDYLEKRNVSNQQSLRDMEDKELKGLAQDVIKIFREFMKTEQSTRSHKHFNKYYQPLINLLKEIPNK